jgi:hypothetical protein
VIQRDEPFETEGEVACGDLDAEQRAFLDNARAALSPNAEAVRNLHARIDGALASHRAEVRNPTASPALRRYARTVGLGLFGLGLGLGAAGGYLWGQNGERTRLSSLTLSTPSISSISAHSAPTLGSPTRASATLPPPATLSVTAVDHALGAPSGSATKPPIVNNSTNLDKRRSTGATDTKPNAELTPADELLLVQRVQRALARREPSLALALLSELDTHIPNGRLLEERAAGKAIALCMHSSPRAAMSLERFKRQFPDSVHLPRVVSTCAAQAIEENSLSR